MKLNQEITKEVLELSNELKDKELLTDKHSIIKNLASLLMNSIKTDEKVAISFSGGIDSTLIAFICNKLNIDFKLYAVGLHNSQDLHHAVKIAKKFNWPIQVRVVTEKDAEKIINKVIKILNKENVVNVVNVGVASVEYAVFEMVKNDDIKIVITGLGSEEIFAGYERHKQNTHEECWKGLMDMYPRDLIRDNLMLTYFNLKAICPYLNKDVVRFAMQIHPSLKIGDEDKKIILRETAIHLGLPEEYALRKKKAAQYGSNFDKALTRLSKKSGYNYKADFLSSFF